MTELKSGLYLFYFDSDSNYHLRFQGYSSGTICFTPSGKGAESCKCPEAVLTVQFEEPGLSSSQKEQVRLQDLALQSQRFPEYALASC